MKKAGHWSGPGEGGGSFTDTTATLRTFFKTATECTMVDLHTIQLQGFGYGLLGAGKTGMQLRYCDKEYDVSFEGVTYAGGTHVVGSTGEPAPRIDRKQIRTVIGTEVDSLDVGVTIDGTEKLPAADGGGGTPRLLIRDAIRLGLFDGALYSLRRLFLAGPPSYPMPNPVPVATTLGAIVLFRGFVAEAKVSRAKATFSVKSYLEKLNIGVPRNAFQAGCLNTLGDRMCGVDLTSSPVGVPLTVTTLVNTVPDAVTVHFPAAHFPIASYPDDYFTFGVAQFTSGVLAGLRRGVRLWLNPLILNDPFAKFIKPMPVAPAIGDTMKMIAGCDKTQHTCEIKFANFLIPSDHTQGVRFRGMPRVPPPDSAG